MADRGAIARAAFPTMASSLVAMLAACVPNEAPPTFTSRDSLGITIVETPETFWTSVAQWSVGDDRSGR